MKKETQRLLLVRKIIESQNMEPTLADQLLKNHSAPSERKVIIDMAAAELCKNGFDSNFEPSEYGKNIEELIDYLNRQNITKKNK